MMRILVVGAGATGGYFGGRLAEAGRDVTFLARARRADQLAKSGLQIVGALGDRTLHPAVVTAADLRSSYDLIVVGVKAFALEAALDDFAPAVGPETTIVPLLNGMRHIDVLVERFGADRVFGGVCIVATTLDDEGRIVALDSLQSLAYGERDGSTTPRARAVDAALRDAGFGARLSETIVLDMWEKWTMLATLGAITSLLRGNVGQIEDVPGGAALALRMFDECCAVATASGATLREPFFAWVRAGIAERGSTRTSSMYRDMQAGHDVEVEHILGDLLGRSRAFSLDAPLLEAAVANLRIYRKTLGSAIAP